MRHRRWMGGVAALGAAIALSVPGVATAHESATGLVYTETNASGGNAVLACARAGDGSLTAIGSFATGGLGSGGGWARRAPSPWPATAAGSSPSTPAAMTSARSASVMTAGWSLPITLMQPARIPSA